MAPIAYRSEPVPVFNSLSALVLARLRQWRRLEDENGMTPRRVNRPGEKFIPGEPVAWKLAQRVRWREWENVLFRVRSPAPTRLQRYPVYWYSLYVFVSIEVTMPTNHNKLTASCFYPSLVLRTDQLYIAYSGQANEHWNHGWQRVLSFFGGKTNAAVYLVQR